MLTQIKEAVLSVLINLSSTRIKVIRLEFPLNDKKDSRPLLVMKQILVIIIHHINTSTLGKNDTVDDNDAEKLFYFNLQLAEIAIFTDCDRSDLIFFLQ